MKMSTKHILKPHPETRQLITNVKEFDWEYIFDLHKGEDLPPAEKVILWANIGCMTLYLERLLRYLGYTKERMLEDFYKNQGE